MYVCLNCHHEQKSLGKECEKCGSRKLVHEDFLRQRMGEHWRELLKADEGKVH